jgi:23S rRNA (pseudouridine1915-N3)-methyltransferase
MLLKLICVGRLKDRAIQSRCDEFVKWLSPYAKFEMVELPDSDVAKEGRAIVKALDKERSAMVAVLSEEGKEFSSTEFAKMVGSCDRKIVFVIGGPYGLAPEVKSRADLLWSLSKLTFTHELARLLLMEQLFRANNILHDGHYHNP